MTFPASASLELKTNASASRTGLFAKMEANDEYMIIGAIKIIRPLTMIDFFCFTLLTAIVTSKAPKGITANSLTNTPRLKIRKDK